MRRMGITKQLCYSSSRNFAFARKTVAWWGTKSHSKHVVFFIYFIQMLISKMQKLHALSGFSHLQQILDLLNERGLSGILS
jgi:hypothetical protein